MESDGISSDARYLSSLTVRGEGTGRDAEPGGRPEVWAAEDDFDPGVAALIAAEEDARFATLDDGADYPIPKKNWGRLSLVKAKDVKEEKAEWLDPEQVIPIGSLTMVQGDPKLGKSTWTFWQAARVTQEGGYVLISSLEDSWASIIKPRLRVAGADLEKVGFVQCDDHPGFSIPKDIRSLEGIVESTEARLLIVDPLMGHISGGVDTYRAQASRKALQPLSQLAERQKKAVIVVNHVTKDASRSDLYRADGSLGGIAGIVRSVLMFEVAKGHTPQESYRTLKHVACNYRKPAPPQDFEIGETDDGVSYILPSSGILPVKAKTDEDEGWADGLSPTERGLWY